ncbi:MAG: adenosylmethionine decarboxylase [Sphingomonadaceae bacterium]|nr:adenosylmethionine decarboxylase [Sphingomonadaceae bacterium]
MTNVIPAQPYDGRHVLADLHGCSAALDDIELIEGALRGAADAAGATVLDVRLHHFGGGQGVTGVALLAESHISIHSWPEHGYAALDFFLCGRKHDIDAALAVFIEALEPERVRANSIERGYGTVEAN